MTELTDPSREGSGIKKRTEFAIGESFCVEFIIWGELRQRHRYVSRADGLGWWRHYDEWTGETWRSLEREPIADVVVHAPRNSAGRIDE